MTRTINWLKYYENTKNSPPSPLLVRAVEYVQTKNKAIDIGGGGTLKDTKYLLSLGFEVTVIDQEEIILESAKEVNSDNLHAYTTSYSDFNFPQEEYDLATAIYSLPFNPPDSYEQVFQKVKNSLVKGGIFCGQFFGRNDAWSHRENMTFHSREEIVALLEGMEIISLEEKEFDGKTVDGSSKHWHVFDVIARRA